MQFYDQYGKPIDRPQSIDDWDFNYGQGFTNTALEMLGISPEQFAANPNLFGGTNGVVKGGIWQDPLDDLYNSGMSDSGSGGSYPTLRQFLDGYNLDNIRYQGNDAPQWQRDALSAYDNALAQKDPLPGFFQITPEYFSGANSPVDGVGGRRYLGDLSGIKYDPKWGFIAPESAYRATSDGKGDFALTSIGAMLAAFAGGVGLSGGFGGAAGELGALGGAEVAGASLDPLLSSSFLADGALGASELSSVLAAEGWSAAEIASLTSSLGGGSGGGMSWWDDIISNISDSDIAGTDWMSGGADWGAGADSGSGLFDWESALGDFGNLDYSYPNSEYGNVSGGVDGPINEFGGSSNNWGDVWNYATETGNIKPLFEKLKSIYGDTNKAMKALQAITGGGGQSGALSALFGGGSGGGIDWASLLGSGASAILTNSQKQAIEGATTTATDMADPFAKERPQYQAQLKNLMTNPAALDGNAAFQNMFNTGLEAVNRTASAKGQLNSGNRLTDLMDYGQKKASEFYFPQAQLLAGLSGATSGSPGQAGALKLGGTLESEGVGAQRNFDTLKTLFGNTTKKPSGTWDIFG